jgi:2-polyprenyl-3-methyl-5-hydroxy-6-metoxy-1,4-benzoquinol methylase
MHKYDYQIDLSQDNAHTRVIRLVGTGKQVLELGCATGYMSRVLAEKFGCTVTGVEVSAEAAASARTACARVIVGDLETLDWSRELGTARFDVIVCADVLEHVREPARLLAALQPFLAPTGYVVASIPNIAHASVLAELLHGRFRYQPLGLLDATHVRFFTRDTIEECFEQAGLAVTHLERLRLEPGATEFRTDLVQLPPEWQAALRAHDESLTYQFVLTAHSAPGGVTRALGDTATATLGAVPAAATVAWPPAGDDAAFWRTRVEGLVDALLARLNALDAERDEARARATHLQGEVEAHLAHIRFLQDGVAARDAEIGRYREYLESAQREVATREGQRQALETRLGEITGSIGWRWLQRWRRMLRVLCPPGSRSGRLYRNLLHAVETVLARRPRWR